MFTILLAILSAKYGETAFGGKGSAAVVGAIAGYSLDTWIFSRI